VGLPPACGARTTYTTVLIRGFLVDRKSLILGVWAAPAAQKTIPNGGGFRPPPFGRVVGVAGAAQSPNTDERRSTKKPCVKNPGVNEITTMSAPREIRMAVPPAGPKARAGPYRRFRCTPLKTKLYKLHNDLTPGFLIRGLLVDRKSSMLGVWVRAKLVKSVKQSSNNGFGLTETCQKCETVVKKLVRVNRNGSKV